MKLVDKLMVYKGQYGFSTLLKNKEDKMYVQVGFRRDQEPKGDKVFIEIHDGFLSFYKDKNGLAKPKIVVLEYQELEQNETSQPMQPNEYFPPLDDSDLPF